MKGGQSDSTMITGEVLRVEGENYFVKGQDGKRGAVAYRPKPPRKSEALSGVIGLRRR